MAAAHSAEAFFKLAATRHSVYALTKTLPAGVTSQRIHQIVKQTFQATPSSFNSQPTRAVVLFGAEHDKLWDHTRSTLRNIVKDDEAWKGTSARMDLFKGAAGTVLFFNDEDVTKGMQEKFALYADKFPHWADQATGMHEYVAWTALAAEGVGANLQHYNPLIDDFVRDTWNVPKTWTLDAQLVFGGRPAEETEAKPKNPSEDVIKAYGA